MFELRRKRSKIILFSFSLMTGLFTFHIHLRFVKISVTGEFMGK